MSAALARLAQSRARMHQVLLPAGSAAAPGTRRRRWRVMVRWLLLRSSLSGLLAPGRRALKGWWHANPWRPAAELAATVAEDQLVPTVRSHPWLSVGVAAALGAGIAVLRPWRWSLLAPLLAHQTSIWRGAALAGLGAELARPETQAALMGALFAATAATAGVRAADDPAGAEPSPHP